MITLYTVTKSISFENAGALDRKHAKCQKNQGMAVFLLLNDGQMTVCWSVNWSVCLWKYFQNKNIQRNQNTFDFLIIWLFFGGVPLVVHKTKIDKWNNQNNYFFSINFEYLINWGVIPASYLKDGQYSTDKDCWKFSNMHTNVTKSQHARYTIKESKESKSIFLLID